MNHWSILLAFEGNLDFPFQVLMHFICDVMEMFEHLFYNLFNSALHEYYLSIFLSFLLDGKFLKINTIPL